MISRFWKLALVTFLALALVACASDKMPASAPGISKDEERVLTFDYSWRPSLVTPRYTSEQLDKLLRASADPKLDGERAEAQASRVAVALASVGDSRFAGALSNQPANVKRAVARQIHYLWTRDNLHYPETEALLKPYR